MAARLCEHVDSGRENSILFVASNTSPNIVGLNWFYERVWARVRARVRGAELNVIGNVVRSMGPPPEGVRYLGPVRDLAPYYKKAAVVISPLTAGSGLKIKLVEALAHGKAIVATSVTVQGVDQEVREATRVVDDPEAFAGAIVELLLDKSLREVMGARARAAAERNFSRNICYAELRRLSEISQSTTASV
jgi:succinoglycan biosynthesis protein ExoO